MEALSGARSTIVLRDGDQVISINASDAASVRVGDSDSEIKIERRLPASGDYIVTLNGRTIRAVAVTDGNRRLVWADGDVFEFTVEAVQASGFRPQASGVHNSAGFPRSQKPEDRSQTGAFPHSSAGPWSADRRGDIVTAPMPGTVRKIVVEVGQAVAAGDTLLVLEAMKMELPLRAPARGTVTAIHCREGEMVGAAEELIELR